MLCVYYLRYPTPYFATSATSTQQRQPHYLHRHEATIRKHQNESKSYTLLGRHISPPTCLPSRQPAWLDYPQEVTLTRSEWRAQLSSADVVNFPFLTNHTV